MFHVSGHGGHRDAPRVALPLLPMRPAMNGAGARARTTFAIAATVPVGRTAFAGYAAAGTGVNTTAMAVSHPTTGTKRSARHLLRGAT